MREGKYVFKKDKKWLLIKGKKIYQVANELELCETYFYNVLNGKKACKRAYANMLTNYAGSEYQISDFFDEI